MSRLRSSTRIQEHVAEAHTGRPSLLLASFSMEIRAARASSDVLTGVANARRTGRGPSLVFADISNPYRSMPVMLAEVISVAFEKALQYSTIASAWSAFM